MKIIEITALPNGSHRNQSGNIQIVPDGWAVIPDNMKLENFPFGEVIAEEIDGKMTVTNWVAGVVPEEEPFPEEEHGTGIGAIEQIRADIDYLAIMTGVDL